MHKHKKKLLVVGVTILVIAAGAFAYTRFKSDDEPPGQPTSPVNYDPATPEEEAEGQARKKELQEQQQQAANNSGNKQVTPVVTNASQDGETIFLSAYVPGVLENGGKCTYTVTKGSATVTKVTDGFVNVSNTNCTPLNLNRLEFSSTGDWQVVVSYASTSATGTSQPKTLTVK